VTDKIALKIDGVPYEGWQAVKVERSMAQVSGAFGFKATDIYPGHPEKWYIRMGQECQVEINGQVLITGYVDGVSMAYDAENHSFEVQGRDKTGDLVDCSPDPDSAGVQNGWQGVSVLSIIKELCAFFDVPVVVDPTVLSDVAETVERATGDITFKVNEGESAFEAISRLLSSKAVLPITYGDGKLTLTRMSNEYVSDYLVSGGNIKAGSYEATDLERYSVYVVKAQNIGLDTFSLDTIAHVIARYNDPYIKRTRPLVIVMDKSAVTSEARDRAEWEARVRAGKSRKLHYEVVGWTQSNGDPWPINRRVIVQDAFFGIEATYLIEGVAQTYDDRGGTISQLTLVPPETYDLTRLALKVKGGKGGFDLDPKVVADFLKS
jgi:prophage tail gpP-like protein